MPFGVFTLETTNYEFRLEKPKLETDGSGCAHYIWQESFTCKEIFKYVGMYDNDDIIIRKIEWTALKTGEVADSIKKV